MAKIEPAKKLKSRQNGFEGKLKYKEDNGDDFTAQAALSLTRATQTSNIMDSKTYYDISFRTTTSGTIKTVEMNFPPGTYVGAAVLVEATGIGSGTISASGSTGTGMKITYTVTNAVNVPALTKIRIQIAIVNNPATPSTSLTVRITTRNSSNTIIDGPTPTSAYNMDQIGTGQIEDGAITSTKPNLAFMKRVTVLDNAAGHAIGWDPNGLVNDFVISGSGLEISGRNSALISAVGLDYVSPVTIYDCLTMQLFPGSPDPDNFLVSCETAPTEGTELHYILFNLPPNVV
jgi:hypothetical protein